MRVTFGQGIDEEVVGGRVVVRGGRVTMLVTTPEEVRVLVLVGVGVVVERRVLVGVVGQGRADVRKSMSQPW